MSPLTNGVTDHVQTVDELTESGIRHTEDHIHDVPAVKELDASKLTIKHSKNLRDVPGLDSKEVWSFKACTDHQVMISWTEDAGWHAPEIKP